VAGVLLLSGLARTAGRPALTGAARSAGAGIVAGALAYGLLRLVPLPDTSLWADLAAAAGVSLAAGAVFLGVTRLLDPDGLRGLLRA
jgi:hypothetical protein